MREITDTTQIVDSDLTDVPEIKEAIALAEMAAYTPEKLQAYDDYWKAVSSERTLLYEREMKGKAEGKAEEKTEIAQQIKNEGISVAIIEKCTGLTQDEIERL